MATATMAAPAAECAVPEPPLRPYRWSLGDYWELREIEALRGVQTLLIRGEIFTVPPPKPPHNLALGLADDWLRGVLPPGYHVRGQMAFGIGESSDPLPDLAVVAGNRRDYEGRQATVAALVVEVADSSLALDTTTKAELYATAGVPDYWVIDVEGRRLLVYRDPQPLPAGLGATAYRTCRTFGETDSVAPLAAPRATVTVADLLPRSPEAQS